MGPQRRSGLLDKGKYISPAGIRIDDRPGRRLVSKQTTLFWFYHIILLIQCGSKLGYTQPILLERFTKHKKSLLPQYNSVLFQRSFSALSRNLLTPASGFRHLYGVTVLNNIILILTTTDTRINSPATPLIYKPHIKGRPIPTPVNKHVL